MIQKNKLIRFKFVFPIQDKELFKNIKTSYLAIKNNPSESEAFNKRILLLIAYFPAAFNLNKADFDIFFGWDFDTFFSYDFAFPTDFKKEHFVEINISGCPKPEFFQLPALSQAKHLYNKFFIFLSVFNIFYLSGNMSLNNLTVENAAAELHPIFLRCIRFKLQYYDRFKKNSEIFTERYLKNHIGTKLKFKFHFSKISTFFETTLLEETEDVRRRRILQQDFYLSADTDQRFINLIKHFNKKNPNKNKTKQNRVKKNK